jgi:hypothetical protein
MDVHKIHSLYLLFLIDWVAAGAKMPPVPSSPNHKANILAKTHQTIDGMEADEWRLGGTGQLQNRSPSQINDKLRRKSFTSTS